MLRRYREWRERRNLSLPGTSISTSPLLSLPRELREMIYDDLRQDVFVDLRHTNNKLSYPNDNIDMYIYPDDLPPIKPAPWSGIRSFSRTMPPLALLLACKQVYHELQHTPSPMVFEIGPLTPHHSRARFDPTYEKLANCTRLLKLANLVVSIELTDLSMTDTGDYYNITVDECASTLKKQSGMLVAVLRTQGKNSGTITINWTDHFGDEGDGHQLRRSVLAPFSKLEGVPVKLGKSEFPVFVRKIDLD